MPVRTASWNWDYGLIPIFDMNQPEGALHAHLLNTFRRATGTFDEFDLLTVVGRTQIGRIRYSGEDAQLTEDVPFQSIDDILKARRGGQFFQYLLNTFAVHSGLSGVQPKVMIRGVESVADGRRQSQSFKGATHIVKFWEAKDCPKLAANEYFCLLAARKLGLTVSEFHLSQNGHALVIKRFDLREDGTYLGFEDFCVLNGTRSSEKYRGGYETRLFKRASEFIDADLRISALRELFRLFVLNCAIRNGDAHLKNFGIVYDNVTGPARLAPVYDLVTTRAYPLEDALALTLDGSTRWPNRQTLTRLGQARCDLTPHVIKQIFEQTADALSSLAGDIAHYFKTTAASRHREIGDRMIESWQAGIRDSLRA